MTFPKARVIVAACLFLAWLGFLFYLAIDARAEVISKPQFLVAQLIVVVDVKDKNGAADPDVSVDDVLWEARGAVKQQGRLTISELPALTRTHGYRGPGKYLVPLFTTETGVAIVPVPQYHVPGYKPRLTTHGTVALAGVFSRRTFQRLPIDEAKSLHENWKNAGYKPTLHEEDLRIYSWSADTRAQIGKIVESRK